MTAQELKNAILMRAVQGKLVPQDPNDEPASVLLEKIRAEKEQLMKEKKIKKEAISIIYKDPSDNQHYEKIGKDVKCIEDEIPFEIPGSWEWCRLSDLAMKIGSGSTPTGGKNVYVSSGIKFIRSQNVYNDGLVYDGIAYITQETNDKKPGSIVCPNDILLNITGGSIGRCAIVPSNFDTANVNQHVMIIRLIDRGINDYLHTAIISPYIQNLIMSVQVGVSREGLSATKLKNFLIPLPPLSGQRKIISRITEFNSLLNQYGICESELTRLENILPDKLKKSILQYAIQGKLVPQDPNDEPATVLLERIRAEKEQMIKDGKIKRDKNESYIYRGSDNSYYISFHGVDECMDDEILFEIPDNWCWVTLSSICTYIQRGKSPKYSDLKKIPVVAQKCNHWSGFDISKAKFIEPESIDKYEPERFLCTGDLLWNSTGLGTVGRMAIYDESQNPYNIAVADSHVSVIRTKDCFANYRYLFYWFTSPAVQAVIESKTEGSTKQKELYLQKIKDYVVPLPPLNEQDRIVNEIDKYMSFDF